MLKNMIHTALIGAVIVSAGCSDPLEDELEERRITPVCEIVYTATLGAEVEECKGGCNCPEECDAQVAYDSAYCQIFPDECKGGGGPIGFANGDSSKTVGGDVPQDVIDDCLRVATITYTESFNCRDFTKWFLVCLEDRGHEGTGLSMWCKNCDDGKGHGHRVSIIKHDGKFCPIEPGWGDGSIVTSCCKDTKAAAEECAHNKYCAGLWPNRDEPADRYSGCEPDNRTPRTCGYCLNEPCTPEEKETVCELIGIDEDLGDCKDKTTNAECTQCCIDMFPDRGNDFDQCISNEGAGCALK